MAAAARILISLVSGLEGVSLGALDPTWVGLLAQGYTLATFVLWRWSEALSVI